ncbi:hypothetical protein FKP32DRAFT_1680271 [Trametes sanguinea]|nr:hypothetical protein FKP32DRAFT_1680271 [Trametes sanguinea]
MSACSSTIFIPAYDHNEELESTKVILDRWNAQAFRSKPYTPRTPYFASLAGQPLCASFQSIQLNEKRPSATLSCFAALPDEVLSRILSLLEPQDLLKMSRLSWSLRRKLMSRNSQPVWTSSLQNAPHDVPPCPSFMNEPHYVALLFDPKNCMGCGALGFAHQNIARGWQLCQRCEWSNLISIEEVENRFKQALQPHGLLEHPLFSKWYLHNVLVHLYVNFPEGCGIHSQYYFYEPEVNMFLAEYLPLIIRLINRGEPADDMLRLLLSNRFEFVQAVQVFMGQVHAWRLRVMRHEGAI